MRVTKTIYPKFWAMLIFHGCKCNQVWPRCVTNCGSCPLGFESRAALPFFLLWFAMFWHIWVAGFSWLSKHNRQLCSKCTTLAVKLFLLALTLKLFLLVCFLILNLWCLLFVIEISSNIIVWSWTALGKRIHGCKSENGYFWYWNSSWSPPFPQHQGKISWFFWGY